MALYVDFRPAVVIGGLHDFEAQFGPLSANIEGVGKRLAPTTLSGSLHIAEVNEDAFAAFLGGPALVTDDWPPQATLSWGLAVEASQPLRTPCPSLWRHPLQWLRWNPFMVDGLLVTDVKLSDVRITADDGEIIWEVEADG